MIRIFAGYDAREAAGFHAFLESLIRHHGPAEPFSVTPVRGSQRDGTNAFTYARFLVPLWCDFTGYAVFLDGSDMLVRSDLSALMTYADPRYAVRVVKHDYRTKHPRKYLGTTMEAENADYPRKNWSSVVLWNCGHPANRVLTRVFVAGNSGSFLHRFGWLQPSEIGSLSAEWNVLIGEQENDNPKIAHFTLGIPGISHYQNCAYSQEWRDSSAAAVAIPESVLIEA